mmetsp:Transcript_76261/g.220233  ORF Transcript_76261/g.220233 Transcript_76261/m.220233 type:complete len:321 (-) Transcript_76261:1192-2154(-)
MRRDHGLGLRRMALNELRPLPSLCQHRQELVDELLLALHVNGAAIPDGRQQGQSSRDGSPPGAGDDADREALLAHCHRLAHLDTDFGLASELGDEGQCFVLETRILLLPLIRELADEVGARHDQPGSGVPRLDPLSAEGDCMVLRELSEFDEGVRNCLVRRLSFAEHRGLALQCGLRVPDDRSTEVHGLVHVIVPEAAAPVAFGHLELGPLKVGPQRRHLPHPLHPQDLAFADDAVLAGRVVVTVVPVALGVDASSAPLVLLRHVLEARILPRGCAQAALPAARLRGCLPGREDLKGARPRRRHGARDNAATTAQAPSAS